jgi:tRNA 2-thiouridine synthesizing protein E
MGIEINGKTIETDEEGYLVNLADWNENVAVAIAKAENIDMTETHWGLVETVREYYEEKQKHPWGTDLVHLLGKHVKETAHEVRHDVNDFLYKMFPHSPEKQLAKIAGLPKPLPADTE